MNIKSLLGSSFGGTVKSLNFARNLILLILQVMKIHEIKYPQKFKFYIDSDSKISRIAKLSTCKMAVIFNLRNSVPALKCFRVLQKGNSAGMPSEYL